MYYKPSKSGWLVFLWYETWLPLRCGDLFADETWLPLRFAGGGVFDEAWLSLRFAEPLRSAGALSNLQMSLCDMFVVSTVPFKRV